MDSTTIGGANDTTTAAIFAQQAQQVPQVQQQSSSGLLFAVDLGILAWGIARHNKYLMIVGGGFLAYHLWKGSL